LTAGQIEEGEGMDFVVAAGNSSAMLAGWYAKKMGLPIRKIVCGSNRNRAVAEFFKTGVYNAKREVMRTMSTALDVAVASNIERLLFEISGQDAKYTAERMQQLADNKEYTITTKQKTELDGQFFANFASEDDVVEAMYDVFEEYGYASDPQTGVALAAKDVYRYEVEKENKKDKTPIVVISTANPYKFPQDVLYCLSGNDVKDSFKGVKRLHLLTAMKPPKCLLDIRYKPIRFKAKVKNKVKEMADAVIRFVDGEVVPEPKE
jgi:threonine synthase